MKSIDVEFVPGERVLVTPVGATATRAGTVLRVAAYHGGCRSYRVQCEADNGVVYSVVVGANELAASDAFNDQPSEPYTPPMTPPWHVQLNIVAIILSILTLLAVLFWNSGCAAVQRNGAEELATSRPTVDVTENPKGVESHSKTEQTGVINNSAAGNTGFAFSTTVGAGIVAIFVAMILAFFGFLILQEVLSHKRAMARDAHAIGGGK